jgi:hypothetical protein
MQILFSAVLYASRLFSKKRFVIPQKVGSRKDETKIKG